MLLLVLTNIINLLLESVTFADDWKCALVNPLLKKVSLDLLYKNYRPVSNLQCVSKLTERAVSNQTHNHIIANAIYLVLQSSYRQPHSTETALLKVMNDILVKMNSQHVTLLVLLDLSAAFDTVDQQVLLNSCTLKLVSVGILLIDISLTYTVCAVTWLWRQRKLHAAMLEERNDTWHDTQSEVRPLEVVDF